MKKNMLYILSVLILTLAAPMKSMAVVSDKSSVIESSVTTPAEIAKQKIDRLNEIKALDKSGLSRIQKKELRKEVISIRSELRTMDNNEDDDDDNSNGGIYLSLGAIILIVVLLIILF